MNVKDLINAKNSTPVLYTDFTRLKLKKPLSFFAFYEGKDAPYYYNKLLTVIPDLEISPIKCKGKSMVKKMYRFLNDKGELAGIKTGFFIDRDFDKNDEAYVVTDFYVTNRYSIENYYVSEDCFMKIMRNELGITEENKDFEIILSRFRSFQQSYHQSTSLFNAWYYCIKNSDTPCNVSLEETLPHGYLEYDYDNWKVSMLYTLDQLNDNFSQQSHEVTEQEIESVSAELDMDPIRNYRGKYEMTCLVCFMRQIQDELNRKRSMPGELSINPYRKEISSSNCMSLWAQYTDSDVDQLRDYILKRVQ